MSLSYPSKRITVLDVPEVKDFRAQFIYNFFTPDESLNDSGEVPDDIRKLPAESFDAARIDRFRRVIPRLVKFDFSRVTLHAGLTSNEFVQRPSHALQVSDLSIAANISQIQTESEFSGFEYTGFEFQDDNLDKKLFTIVSGSIAKRIVSKNRGVINDINEIRGTVLDRLSDEHSLLDAAKALADETSEGVSDNLVVSALNQIDSLKLKLIDDVGGQQIISDAFARVRNVAIRGQVSNRLVGRVVKNIVNDPMSTFSDEFVKLKPKAIAVQDMSVARSNPKTIFKHEFEPTFNAIRKLPVDAHDYTSSTQVTGYIIEKHELLSDGSLKQHAPIIIENADISTAVDLNVAYGRTYIYTIQTVAQLKVKASIEDADDIMIGIGLVSSRKSPRIFVACVEAVPPPPVSDFNVIWNFTHDVPFLMWSFPPNRQRDVKKFQVFRRFSINEPFQLVKEYDFDDSAVKAVNNETPDPQLVEKLKSAKLTYIDSEFRKSWHAIYAICCIDAHGFSSNYSMQLEISFDSMKNRINKKIISFAGAPLSYPNMMLNADLFVDVMKVSGHTRLKTYFDPEFLKVVDTRGNDLKLISAKNVDDGKYRLQIINTDIMEQEIIDIIIDDMRPATKR